MSRAKTTKASVRISFILCSTYGYYVLDYGFTDVPSYSGLSGSISIPSQSWSWSPWSRSSYYYAVHHYSTVDTQSGKIWACPLPPTLLHKSFRGSSAARGACRGTYRNQPRTVHRQLCLYHEERERAMPRTFYEEGLHGGTHQGAVSILPSITSRRNVLD